MDKATGRVAVVLGWAGLAAWLVPRVLGPIRIDLTALDGPVR